MLYEIEQRRSVLIPAEYAHRPKKSFSTELAEPMFILNSIAKQSHVCLHRVGNRNQSTRQL
jgi:hypothetical protein